MCFLFFFFFFKQKTAYEMLRSLVGSEMCIRDSRHQLVVVQGFFYVLHSPLSGSSLAHCRHSAPIGCGTGFLLCAAFALVWILSRTLSALGTNWLWYLSLIHI
eukprot:TRINITY_DN6865_c0_g1_i2.p1 TRINITY_DN6865_c0_g1~~TRINITY_DN6865_c0_g1_i2.p1  ORF type:complete len:103 (+),score=30.74 TRINITY_DN6865_c0_g1_i2:56-364(+)